MKREEEVMLLLKKKLGISDLTELSHTEEKISKSKALLLFENGLLDAFEVGTFKGLSQNFCLASLPLFLIGGKTYILPTRGKL